MSSTHLGMQATRSHQPTSWDATGMTKKRRVVQLALTSRSHGPTTPRRGMAGQERKREKCACNSPRRVGRKDPPPHVVRWLEQSETETSVQLASTSRSQGPTTPRRGVAGQNETGGEGTRVQLASTSGSRGPTAPRRRTAGE